MQNSDILQQSRQALATTARKAFQRHLTASTLGVISMRLPQERLFLITPPEKSFENIRREDIYLIDASGNLKDGPPDLTLPSETKFHLQSYMVRTDINAIAHLHPTYISAYALKGKLFELTTNTARNNIKEILRVQCSECISRYCGLCSCRTDIRTSYAGVDVLLLKEDGIVTLGTSLEDALILADLAEKTSQEISLSSGWLCI